MSARRLARHSIWIDSERFKFSAAHMTVFPDGRKERLHGHNFQLGARIYVRSVGLAELLDFGLLKGALTDVCGALDERVLLPLHNPYLRVSVEDAAPDGAGPGAGRARVVVRHKEGEYVLPRADVVLLPLDNISSEQLAVYCHGRLVSWLRARLPPEIAATVEEVSVTVSERPGQGGEYCAALGDDPIDG